VTVLRGLYEGELRAREPLPADPVVLFAGRHIPEKQVTAIVPAFVRAREELPGLGCTIYGDGPEHDEVLRQIETYGLEDVAEAPGFVSQEQVEQALRRALCLVLPSRREGYGLVVVEAIARATPVVVVRGPDNAAVELVEEGVNGFVAASASPEDLGEAIVRVHRAGAALRQSTAAWFARNAQMLSLESSLAVLSRRLEERADRA
jgi:glycosyltransferase involved in cell wall biosynthesis